MTYLWVALGSALGGMARFWLGGLAATLWGAAFPWGTILINITGSFVIGFFGTLTAAADSRFAVPTEIRAFVMVGLCGGFTTFSSFSLQTLDLARDGRPGQALANIALSLALCLGAVAAGHYGAAALDGGRIIQETAVGTPPAGGVVLAVLDRPDSAPAVLAAAARLLEPGGGHIDALALTPSPAAAVMPTEEIHTAEREAEIAAIGGEPGAALRGAFDRWAGSTDLRCGWSEVAGQPGGIVAERAGRADIAVMRRPERFRDDPAHQALHAALFDAGCPVLVVPPGMAGRTFGDTVVVAWKEDGRAAKAVLSALPWLRRAGRIVVLRGGRNGEGSAALPPVLAEHGLEAEAVAVPANDGPMGAALLAVAQRIGADLLVMGAFAHGETRELVLGGVTRHVLAEADLPVLMRH